MSDETLSDQEVLHALRNAAVFDNDITQIRSQRLLWLLDRIKRLEDEVDEMLPQILDPNATCCGDASRIHKAQRLEIERLAAMLPTVIERAALQGMSVHCKDEATLAVVTSCIDRIVDGANLKPRNHAASVTNIEFARARFESMSDRPRMWAGTKEAFALQLVLLVEIVQLPDAMGNDTHLMTKLFGPGNAVPQDALTDEWAHQSVAIIRKHLGWTS